MNPVHFSSASDEWSTPQDLFDRLHEEFNFGLDVCATKENAKCDSFIVREDDALTRDWNAARKMDEYAWMNPPYGRVIGLWVRKASESRNVVALLPARTDTKWFHKYIWDAKRSAPRSNVEIRPLKGRLKFGGAKNSAPFPSMIVVFR